MEAIWGISLKMGLHQPASATASIPFLLISKRKGKRASGVKKKNKATKGDKHNKNKIQINRISETQDSNSGKGVQTELEITEKEYRDNWVFNFFDFLPFIVQLFISLSGIRYSYLCSGDAYFCFIWLLAGGRSVRKVSEMKNLPSKYSGYYNPISI